MTTETINRYAVYFDDGEHSTVIEAFQTVKEAWDFYYEQIKLFKSGVDEFYKQFISDAYDATLLNW